MNFTSFAEESGLLYAIKNGIPFNFTKEVFNDFKSKNIEISSDDREWLEKQKKNEMLEIVIRCQICGTLEVKKITPYSLYLHFTREEYECLCQNCSNERESILWAKEHIDSNKVYSYQEMMETYSTEFDSNIKKWIELFYSFKNYSKFLSTPYWKAIREEKLNRSNHKCILCKSTQYLSVHHKDYENHGLEHKSDVIDNDLVVLCDKCHKKFHEIRTGR